MKKTGIIISIVAVVITTIFLMDIGVFGKEIQDFMWLATKIFAKWAFVGILYLAAIILPSKIIAANERNEKRHAEFLAEQRIQAEIARSKNLENKIEETMKMEDYL